MNPSCRNPIQCIVPPYIVEHMARGDDPRLREWALVHLARAAAIRAVRSFVQQMPAMMVSASPTGKKQRLVYDARKKDVLPGRLVRSEGEGKTADLAVNEAYDYSGDTFDFFFEVFGRNSLDDAGMSLVSSVHVGEADGRDRFQPMNNAFWDGSQMAYGDGDGVVFQCFTRSLDVVGHELTHGVQSFTSNLLYRGQSGALNEHFSDVFGILVRQWRQKESATEASWLIGKEVLVPAPTRRGIRDMEHPGTAYRDDPALGTDPQPDHMSKLYSGPADSGGVHINYEPVCRPSEDHGPDRRRPLRRGDQKSGQGRLEKSRPLAVGAAGDWPLNAVGTGGHSGMAGTDHECEPGPWRPRQRRHPTATAAATRAAQVAGSGTATVPCTAKLPELLS